VTLFHPIDRAIGPFVAGRAVSQKCDTEADSFALLQQVSVMAAGLPGAAASGIRLIRLTGTRTDGIVMPRRATRSGPRDEEVARNGCPCRAFRPDHPLLPLDPGDPALREHDSFGPSPVKRGGRRRFDDEDPTFLKSSRPAPRLAADPDPPDTGDRWSSWDTGLRGPEPYPEWVVTELAAVDTELGVLKTGKEADVHLVRRGVPDGPSCLLAVKRYRDPDHRMFHRDAGYLEGRRVRRSRETRAMATRTAFGKQLIAGQWAAAEFDALSRLWPLGRESGAIRVPYPVQLLGTELLLEFIGDAEAGQAAPRLAQTRPGPAGLAQLWVQLVDALTVLARAGLAHGDLSPYNLLVHDGQLVMIDLPQVVDVVANPRGVGLLARDVDVVTRWFLARGLEPAVADAEALTAALLFEAGLR
jgi:RIO kinase 1